MLEKLIGANYICTGYKVQIDRVAYEYFEKCGAGVAEIASQLTLCLFA